MAENFYDRLKITLGTKYATEGSAFLAGLTCFVAYRAGFLSIWAALFYFFASLSLGGIGSVLRTILQTMTARVAMDPRPASEIPGLPRSVAVAASKLEVARFTETGVS